MGEDQDDSREGESATYWANKHRSADDAEQNIGHISREETTEGVRSRE